VVPLLNKYRMPGVFAVPLEAGALVHATGQPIKPWEEWVSLRHHGHEIAAHGVSHQDLTTLAPAELREELTRPQATLQAATLVYPGGAYTEAVAAEAKKYYTAARTVRHGFETLPPADPWQLKTVDYTQRNWSLAKANLRALWALATNGWLIETYHLVDIAPSTLHHSVSFAEFRRHLEFIHRLPIAISTINAVISDRHH